MLSDMQTIQPSRRYKVFVSIAFGLAGFLINFYPLDVVIPPHKASFVWGLVFPMLISLSWGWKYGLLAVTVGLGGQTMWFLWLPLNGWAPFVSIILYNLWIIWHGWCAEKNKRFSGSFYKAEIPFRIFSTIIHLTLFPWAFQFNPSPWAPQMTMTSAPAAFVNFIVFKLLVEGFMVLLLADVLLNYRLFQRVLLQNNRPQAKTGPIISAFLLLGLVFWIISGLTTYLFHAQEVEFFAGPNGYTLADSLILNIPLHDLFARIIFVFTCLFAGLIVAKYVARYQESEARYKSFFNNDHLVMLIIDPQTEKIIDANPGACSFYGYEKEELTGKDLAEINTFFNEQIGREMQNASAEKGQHFFCQHRLADGDIRDVEVYSGPIKLAGQNLLYSVVHDITKRKKAEKALHESEELYRSLVENIDLGITLIDSEHNVVMANAAQGKLLRRPPLSFYGKKCFEEFEKRQHICPHCPGVKAMQDGSPRETITEGMRDDGSKLTVNIKAFPVFDKDGGNKGFIEVVEDISERLQTQHNLVAEKERLAVTLRSIGDGVITADMDGNIVLLNKVAENLTGWSSAEAQGLPIEKVFHIINEKTRKPCENPVEKVLNTGQIIALANHTVLITKDGRELSIADSGAPIRDSESRIIGVVLVFRDVTEQLKTEKELLKIKKLESVGILAGGIAHDFNNILAAILGNINLALFDKELQANTRNLLSEAEKASLRAKDLTQQLLTFAKGGDPVRETSSLKNVIQESANFVLHGDKVACEYHIPDNLWLADIDKGQISQVIQNIVINARHAMPGGGTIVISCENLPAVSKKQLPHAKEGRYIKITILDSGIGIADNLIDKIFDPYFSTKHEGSGLGLAICQSIINKHDGDILVESSPSKGTTFTIYLPASDKPRQQPRLEPQIATAAAQNRILVMDDDEMVRNICRAMLGKMGHEVLLARDGREAIDLFKEAKQTGAPIDLVIMDLTIPGGMGGKEAAIELLKFDASAKIVISSGYSNDPTMANYQAHGFFAAIVKPFLLKDLSSVINQALG